MKVEVRVFFCDDTGQRFFGNGPYLLLRAVEETGSLRAAAISMKMAYSKALEILRKSEIALGFSLTQRKIGGQGGGGSCLTPKGKALLKEYAAYRQDCEQYAQTLFAERFEAWIGEKS